jgi:hypothetical protein
LDAITPRLPQVPWHDLAEALSRARELMPLSAPVTQQDVGAG